MLGGTTTQFSAGGAHTCTRFDSAELRCWGDNGNGQLGTGDTVRIGDTENAEAAALVALGEDTISLVGAGYRHTCAVTSADDLYCWGLNSHGQLGYSDKNPVGDNELPATAGPVDVRPASLAEEAVIAQLALGREHSCVLFSTGEVVCWGRADYGQLGQGNTDDWGDGGMEVPADLMPISLDGVATAITAGEQFSCALLDDGDVRCWGRNHRGQLGLGHADQIGDTELPLDADPIDLGLPAISISSGIDHTCAVREDYSVVCWGYGMTGRLGYAATDTVGDDETPASVGPITLF
jgi:alpha-tubulin suppressor-like RCC1 family protein